MNPETKMLHEFIETFDASRDPLLWKKLIREELSEVRGAVEHLLKEVADVMYVITGYHAVGGTLENLADLSEIDYLLCDKMVELFSDNQLELAVRLVHKSNMSKLGEDGKPIRREDGKILKGPNYKEPDMSIAVSLI